MYSIIATIAEESLPFSGHISIQREELHPGWLTRFLGPKLVQKLVPVQVI